MTDPFLDIRSYARLHLVEFIMQVVRPRNGMRFRAYLMRAPMRTLEQIQAKLLPNI